MSRTKKCAMKRKRQVQGDSANKAAKTSNTADTTTTTTTTTLEPKNINTIVSPVDLESTIDTLQTLSEFPSVIKSKACKDVRVAVYNFTQACTTGLNTSAGTNLTSQISAALTDEKYIDALVLLSEMRIRGEAPKLGALCRWVRDLDCVSGLSMQVDGISHTTVPRTKKECELLRVLDAVLRVTGPTDTNAIGPLSNPDPISLQAVWSLRNTNEPALEIRASVLDKSIFALCPKDITSKFQVIETTPGLSRKPPNLHPAVVYLSDKTAMPLSDQSPSTTYHKHPVVPELALIKDALSWGECKSIIAATESIGFLPDAPVRDDGAESSILAHNVYWIVDQVFHDTLWDRVRPFLPTHVGGRKARGINRRFRVYRYVPGAEYRLHIDGAWPKSGVNAVTGAYEYDCSPPDARQSSLFTFLIYLNDEFEGGETTFFIPSVKEGTMNAYPVNPVMGSVAVFPHGETKGALLHEGTGVRKGAKYVIRTDVLYDVEAGLA